MTEKLDIQRKAQEWLYEMELVNDPNLINNLKMNIMVVSPHIKEVEMLFYQQGKQLLIWLEFPWYIPSFLKNRIIPTVNEMVAQLLPNYAIRVVDDYKIMEKSLKKLESVGIY